MNTMFTTPALLLPRVRTVTQLVLWFFATLFAWDHALGRGTFYFQNSYLQFGVDAPVFDAAGNRLEGPTYMAMLYGAATADSLQPIVPAVSFLNGTNAGYFGGGVRAGNGVLPGQEAWLQVRA